MSLKEIGTRSETYAETLTVLLQAKASFDASDNEEDRNYYLSAIQNELKIVIDELVFKDGDVGGFSIESLKHYKSIIPKPKIVFDDNNFQKIWNLCTELNLVEEQIAISEKFLHFIATRTWSPAKEVFDAIDITFPPPMPQAGIVGEVGRTAGQFPTVSMGVQLVESSAGTIIGAPAVPPVALGDFVLPILESGPAPSMLTQAYDRIAQPQATIPSTTPSLNSGQLKQGFLRRILAVLKPRTPRSGK